MPALYKWPPKDPDERLDYHISWVNRIDEGDEIASVAWTVPAGITGGTQTQTATKTTIWLTGGTIGVTYSIACRITTSAGRVMDQTALLLIRAK